MRVPAFLVDWDKDPKYKTDITPLGVDRPAKPWMANANQHRLFNTREYQTLSHEEKMAMMWE